ncbi:MAG: Na+/H+ antiporter NhaC family protein [Bacteroidales bacterium]|nr:Na+/H+ antiporter NhaC family protein [Bacteroidales bacterium]
MAEHELKEIGSKEGWLALSPLVVFLVVYVVSSVLAGDFYKIPVGSAFLVACIYGVCVCGDAAHPTRRMSPGERVLTFSHGASHPNILLMVWIFILAGAFATSAKEIGAVDATVAAALQIMPPKVLFAGLFLTACFISMAVGTSVGTIVALVPLAVGMAEECGQSVPFVTAIIVGGSFFGDNLSFISDTTIAATRSQGVKMRDKFKANLRIVMPAVVLVLLIYAWKGCQDVVLPQAGPYNAFLMIPYLTVIVLAVSGVDVLLTLVVGILMNAVIGFWMGSFGWIGWLHTLGDGVNAMSELIIVTLLAGGLMETIRVSGGLAFIIGCLTHHIKQPRGAYLSIAVLVSLVNLCTANNTIAIITSGDVVRQITERFGLDPRRSASILDIFSCCIQGIIPYGAQLLMAAGLAHISTTAIIPHLYYPFLLGIGALVSIVARRQEPMMPQEPRNLSSNTHTP